MIRGLLFTVGGKGYVKYYTDIIKILCIEAKIGIEAKIDDVLR